MCVEPVLWVFKSNPLYKAAPAAVGTVQSGSWPDRATAVPLCECREHVCYQQAPVFWSEIWMWVSPGDYIWWTDGLVSMWCWEAGWLAVRGVWVMQASHFVQNKVSVASPPLPPLPFPPSYTHTGGATRLYFQNQEPLSPSLWAQYGQQTIAELTSGWGGAQWQLGWSVGRWLLSEVPKTQALTILSSPTTGDIGGPRLFPGVLTALKAATSTSTSTWHAVPLPLRLNKAYNIAGGGGAALNAGGLLFAAMMRLSGLHKMERFA